MSEQIAELFDGVALEGVRPDMLHYNARLGFAQLQSPHPSVIRFVGFGAPLAPDGSYDTVSKEVVPIVDYKDLDPSNQNIDQQGKGVGPRMYNSRQAAGGLWEMPEALGVYTFDIHKNRLHDGRAKQGGPMRQIGRHAFRMFRTKVSDTESVVSGIHKSYGDAEAVVLEVPPHPLMRAKAHGVVMPETVKPQFMIIRAASVVLHQLGTTVVPITRTR